MAGIETVCSKNRLVRSNYYSDTYRAEFTLNGKNQEWDVCHISIPFDRKKEAWFKARFRVTDAEMEEYYTALGRNIKHHLKVSDKLKSLNNPSIDKATAYYEKVTIKQKETKGADVYLISSPSECIIGSQVINDKGARLTNILNLGARLLQTAKVYAENGVSIGSFDLNSMTVDQSSGKAIIKNGMFLFAGYGDEQPYMITPDARIFMHPDVAYGRRKPDASTDIYSICALLWSLLDGRHFMQAPDLGRAPKYVPDDVSAALMRGMREGESVRKDLTIVVRNAAKNLEDGIIEFERPDYEEEANRAVEALEHAEKEKEQAEKEEAEKKERSKKEKAGSPMKQAIITMLMGDDEDGEGDDGEDGDDSEEDIPFLPNVGAGKIILSGVFGMLLSLLLIAGGFFTGKVLGEEGWNAAVPVTAAAEDVSEPEISETPPPDVSPTPVPVATVTPIRESEVPELVFDAGWDWYKTELSQNEFCSVLFCDTYEISEETVEAWNFYTGDNKVMCYVYRHPRDGTDPTPYDAGGGPYVLAIAGNGTGSMKVKMTQTELVSYLDTCFTHYKVAGLSVLKSTGSTPVVFATPMPTPEYEPDEPDSETVGPQPEERQNSDFSGESDGYQEPVYAYSGAGYSGVGYFGGGEEVVYGVEESATVTTTEEWSTGVETRQFTITLSNNSIPIGGNATISTSGNNGGFEWPSSSDPSVCSVTQTPDASGNYICRANARGMAVITFQTGTGEVSVTVTVT